MSQSYAVNESGNWKKKKYPKMFKNLGKEEHLWDQNKNDGWYVGKYQELRSFGWRNIYKWYHKSIGIVWKTADKRYEVKFSFFNFHFYLTESGN